MSPTSSISPQVAPATVHDNLRKHILVDGYPMVLDLKRSAGSYLYDGLSGRRLLDFFTSFSTSPLGYNHPKMRTPEFERRILAPALNKPANSDLYTPEMAGFVSAFARTIPTQLRSHLFFISGGSLAVENTLKAAFDWKVRKNLSAGKAPKGRQIIHFKNAFHGRSGYTLSLTNTADPRKTEYFPTFDWPRISTPQLSFPVTDEVLEQVEATERKAIGEIKQALTDHPDDIAGLILEPIQGEGGDNHFRGEFLQALRNLADENDFLLIFDEVQTGFGATGPWWCFEHFDVLPDLFAFGKKTQVCGISASHRVDEVRSVFHQSSRINSTWGGNLVDMVRCHKIIEIIEEDNLLQQSRDVGKLLLAGLEELSEELPQLVHNARGRGLFCAFDLPATETRDRTLDELRGKGLLALPSGDRAIRFRPPLNLSPEEAAEGLAIVGDVLRAAINR